MRELSSNFMNELKSGFLSGILEKVHHDKDLDLQIRDGYINIYYKGNSLLRITEKHEITVHEKFLNGVKIPYVLNDAAKAESFLKALPIIKENIIVCGNKSLEIEYEQMIIRANNLEPRNNSEYFILDRQYAIRQDRFDLTGFLWARNGRSRNQQVPLAFMEVKFALNSDINEIHNQISRYYNSIKSNLPNMALETETILKQKIQLGMFNQPADRIDALETLTISKNIDECQFIVILVDYNPYSGKLDLAPLRALPFANQIRIFHSGLAMWQESSSVHDCNPVRVI